VCRHRPHRAAYSLAKCGYRRGPREDVAEALAEADGADAVAALGQQISDLAEQADDNEGDEDDAAELCAHALTDGG